MSKKLYIAEMDIVTYFWAEEEDYALSADDALREHMRDHAHIGADAIYPANHISPEWDDGIPYGDAPDDLIDVTVSEIFDKGRENG